MTEYPLATWLARVLEDAGCQVVEHTGWKTTGRPASTGDLRPRAVMWHHDGTGKGPSPGSPGYILEGRPPTDPPPLAHCWVSTRGDWHLLAAGRANHAGIGDGWGVVPPNDGNTYAVGVETDHTTGESWPAGQLTSLRVGTAAILEHLNARASDALMGHREYAPGRKTDPDGLDLDAERRAVAALMEGEDEMAAEWSDMTTDLVTRQPATFGQVIRRSQLAATKGQVAAEACLELLQSTSGGSITQAMVDAAVDKAFQRIAADIADGPDEETP